MIDLSNFIRVDFLRKELEKSSTVVSSVEEADSFALRVASGEMQNVIFEKSYLKNDCFSKIQERCDVQIINCNSNIERFCESLENKARITIFDNVNLCKDINILNIVFNKKGILVC